MIEREPVVEIIDPQVVERLRRMTPAQKLAKAFSMADLAVKTMKGSIRRDHPE